MAGFPQREILEHVMAGLSLVLLADIGSEGAGSVRGDSRAQRVVQRLLVNAHTFHTPFYEPLTRFLVQPG